MNNSDSSIPIMKPHLCSQHNQPIQAFNRMKKPLCQNCLLEQSGMIPVEEIEKKLQQTFRNANMELDGYRQSLQTLIESLNKHKGDLLSELEQIIKYIKNQIDYMNQSEEAYKLICTSKINQLQCREEIEGQQLISQKRYQESRSLIIQKLQDFNQKFINIDHLLKQINENKNFNQKQENTLDQVNIQVKNQEDHHILDSKGFLIKGISLHNLGLYQDAIYCYNQAIRLKLNYPEAYNNKGFSLHNLGKYQDAIKCFDKAIKLNPYQPDTYNNKGFSLHKLSKYYHAIQCYEQAIKLNPNYAEAYNNKVVQ